MKPADGNSGFAEDLVRSVLTPGVSRSTYTTLYASIIAFAVVRTRTRTLIPSSLISPSCFSGISLTLLTRLSCGDRCSVLFSLA